ncbi:MAG TPA: SRPBCC family protein [Caulobacteraceae bacterium]|jgi:uncharacterized protein YndB with AHSA1/START domain
MVASRTLDGWIAGELPEDGSIRRVGDDRWEIRIERLIPRPIEKAWAALTIPERLADWMGEPAELDLRVGGRYQVSFPGEGDNALRGVITDYDPPHLLAYDWGFGNIRWALAADGQGCRITFSQVGLTAWWLLGGSAGWHAFLDDLTCAIVEGKKADFGSDHHVAIEARYRRHFGPHVPGSDTPPALRHHDLDGVATEVGPGVYTLRFERFFMLPIEKVWAALTDPVRLADWFAQARIDLRIDGEVEFRWETSGHTEKGFIVALDPPRLLAWATPTPDGRHQVVRWALTQEDPEKIGVRLVLTHTLVPTQHLLSVATGWHVHLWELPEAALRPEPLPWTLERERERAQHEFATHVPRYRAKLPREAADVPWTG